MEIGMIEILVTAVCGSTFAVVIIAFAICFYNIIREERDK